MGETHELQLQVTVQGTIEPGSELHNNVRNHSVSIRLKKFKWWLRMAVYTFFVLSGQTIATLLGRLYYDKGGNSKWMATLVQLVGFPVFLPYLFYSPPEKPNTNSIHRKQPSVLIVATVYIALGLLLAGNTMMYSIGLLYLPVSTYSLICASQLAFNAFFSFFLNSQKFTPYIINSLVLLTISSTLLVFQPDSSDPTGKSKGKYAIGFLCTIGASAGYGLTLSLTQLAFRKVLRKDTYRAVLELIIYPSLVATVAAVIGLFASREWEHIRTEMQEFKLGTLSYVMTLAWIALSWQVFSIGAVCLIYEVSSLFSNAISTLGLPIVPIFAVILFHDKMDGIKVIAMILALWGFVSYLYQQYLDEAKSKSTRSRAVNEASPIAET